MEKLLRGTQGTAYGVWIQGPMVGYKDKLQREGKKIEQTREQMHRLGFSCPPKAVSSPKASCGFSFNSIPNIPANFPFRLLSSLGTYERCCFGLYIQVLATHTIVSSSDTFASFVQCFYKFLNTNWLRIFSALIVPLEVVCHPLPGSLV